VKKLELIITQSKKTKVTVDIPEKFTLKEEYQFINAIINKSDVDMLIFEETSEGVLDINEITDWNIIE